MSRGIHLRPISEEVLKITIRNMSLKTSLELLSYLPVTNELNWTYCLLVGVEEFSLCCAVAVHWLGNMPSPIPIISTVKSLILDAP